VRVRYTAQAFADREGIFTYLEERNPPAARAVKSFMTHAIARLADFPFSAPGTDEPGVRELNLVRYPYKIYYRVALDEIWILHIRDSRRHPWGEDER
jgi:plasmid stabilization system protein ParE